jgi:hypothetical protein
MIAGLIQALSAVLLALLLAGCAVAPAPPAGRAEAPRPASPNAVSPPATNCDAILARNKLVDEAARVEWARVKDRDDTHKLPPAWAGACVQTSGGAWAVVLDEAHYGGVHAVTWHIIHLDADGHASAGEPQHCNLLDFALEPKGDDVTVRQTCEGPEKDRREALAFHFTGTEVRAEVASMRPFVLIKRLDRFAELFPLRQAVAVVWMGDLIVPSSRAGMLLVNAGKVITDTPIELPEKAYSCVSMAGQWPGPLDVVVATRKPAGEANLKTTGFEHTPSGWKERPYGRALFAVGERTVSIESGATRYRALRGPPLPNWTPTPRPKGCSPDDHRKSALQPVILSSWGGGMAAYGDTCDGRPAVELFAEKGGPGVLHVLPIEKSKDADPPMGHLLSHGGDLWIITYAAALRLDGSSFREVPLPPGRSNITDAVLADDGRLWLADGGKLFERTVDGIYIDHGSPAADEPVEQLALEANGHLLVLTPKALYE